ncbi:MAG TPA: hypothetical protein VE487_16365 [Ilumatobacter sp.]|nr:hypothetical protein [Ilumatobacter sp.]
MALDRKPEIVDDIDRHATGPLAVSLRWGLGWTVVIATLGAAPGCVTATPVDDPVEIDDPYSACVTALDDMPDAVNQHIDPCRAVAAATAAGR